MAVLSLIIYSYRGIYSGLTVIGKVLLLPLFIASTLILSTMIIPEFFIFDIWIIVLEVLSKERDIKWLFEYFLDF